MWSIVCRPEERYEKCEGEEGEDVDRSCMRVILRNTDGHEDVMCRVGRARRDTKNPDKEYDEVLDTSIKKARESVLLLNDMIVTDGEL